SGQFAGYPFRTYVGNNFTGGYSDHFPVYLFLIKEKK
ncbi:MAG TPA: endonuclease/exonuclease/phosphatase family protein, partial [Tenuifilaceae bacterium]|nr:endonuclease/exonuclease/phosphatase family protein [Tenuifilaceae bacterium]